MVLPSGLKTGRLRAVKTWVRNFHKFIFSSENSFRRFLPERYCFRYFVTAAQRLKPMQGDVWKR